MKKVIGSVMAVLPSGRRFGPACVGWLFALFLLSTACGGSAAGGGSPAPSAPAANLGEVGARTQVPQASELVKQAEASLAAEDAAGAKSLLEQAIQRDPGDARARLDLGIALEMLDDLDAAESEYRQAIAIQSDFSEALNNLGVLLRRKGELVEAISVLREAVEANPGSAAGHMNLALALEDSGALGPARAEYQEALRLEPNAHMTRVNLGLLLLKLQEPTQAARELKTAMGGAANDRAALLAIGNGLRRAGEAQTAVRAVQAAIQAGDGQATPALLAELSLAQRAAGHREAAVGSLRQAIALDGNYAIAHYLLANMLAAGQAYQEAVAHYEKYLKLEPEGVQAQRARERLGKARAAARRGN